MQDLTVMRLRRLAKEMLKIVRSDSDADVKDIISIMVSKDGYMSVDGSGTNEWRSPGINHWSRINGQTLETTEKFTCFDCKYCGGDDKEGICLCTQDMHETEWHEKACKHFKEDIHE